jgi:hypothetical protein
MNATQILEQILSKTDEELLATLPTTPRIACVECQTVSVVKRAHYAQTSLCYCPTCRKEVKTAVVTYYVKNKTSEPAVAVERHRKFWNEIYYQQLGKEHPILSPGAALAVATIVPLVAPTSEQWPPSFEAAKVALETELEALFATSSTAEGTPCQPRSVELADIDSLFKEFGL